MTRITKSRNPIVAYTVPKLKDFSPAALDKAAERLLAALKKESADIKAESDWKLFRDRWMARKNGVLTQINELWLKAAPKDAKREVGQRVNEIKKRVEDSAQRGENGYKAGAKARIADSDSVDISLPGLRRPIGAEHPIIKTRNEILSVFRNL